ncbi:MAG: hypothetical protein VX764_00425 [Planctomycetota bacterium]|nr:hypothetical protein [Planctomycetota bacterium]
MKSWIPRLTILLLLLAVLSSIPALPLGVDLRGRWLQVHLIVAAPLAILIVSQIWWVRTTPNFLQALAWLSISAGLGSIVVPLLALVGTDSIHLWVENHGWLSILGVGLLGIAAARKQRNK